LPSKYLRGEDSLLSIVQMPQGHSVATRHRQAGAANRDYSPSPCSNESGLRERLDVFARSKPRWRRR
jgi:phosphoribosylcarboxyaminoimidazole (NCAIR) mutase